MSVNDIDNLLNCPNEKSLLGIRDKAMLEILYATGIRISELVKIKKADINAKSSILSLLGRDSNEQSLQLLISALKETDSIQLAAIEALSKWPDHGPVNDLLKIASEEDNPNKDAALNSYIVLSSKSPNPTLSYRKALELDNSTATAKKILGGLGQSGGIQSLEIIRPYLENSETINEAALAATQVAKRHKDSHTAEVRTA